MEKIILINAKHPEEKRVAIVEGKRLTDFYVEVASSTHLRGNVCKGVITAVEPGLQAAFVNFGEPKDGFLPIQDVMPEYYKTKTKEKHPKIKDVLAKGQELVVQVVQDPRDTKGASLTTYLSLPGRYLVIMPGKGHVGVSRKIEDKGARERLKEAFQGLKTPKNMDFILRTAGRGRSTEDLANDLKYLTRLWNKIKREAKKAQAPALIYKEEDIAVRTVRDYLTPDVTEVLVDEREAFQKVKTFLKRTMPWREINVTHYREKQPLFDRYGLEDQIVGLSDREVYLPSKGSVVIDKTEALTAIDVNTGRSKKEKDFEALILRTNLEAAEEIARQLRLRDIGGLIVIDFIDMESGKNRQKVEDRLRAALSLDKAHYDTSRISKFGLLEMTRERMRTAYFQTTSRACPTCGGLGVVKPPSVVAMSALRDIHVQLSSGGALSVTCRLPVDSANYLLNQLRGSLAAMEAELGTPVTVIADPTLPPGEVAVDVERTEPEAKEPAAKKKRTRRGRRRPAKKEQAAAKPEVATSQPDQQPAQEEAATAEATASKPAAKRKRRSRSPRKKTAKPASQPDQQPAQEEAATAEAIASKPAAKRKRRPRSPRKKTAKPAAPTEPQD